MGSNMAECHPVGFQWVTEGKLRGAKVFHVDPRFTRTSAMADRHLPIRAGSDIAFLGGVINYILANGREFREYVQAYTNASQIISPDIRLPDDLDGVFSGFDPDKKAYEQQSWQYEGLDVPVVAAAGKKGRGPVGSADEDDAEVTGGEQFEGASIDANLTDTPQDPTLEHPRCVFQLLRRHYARYTPEMVEEACGVDRDAFVELCEALCANSGRERTSAFVYSVGWTQHTTGVQYIKAATIVQLLLGNIGRPGGGILALRGHASIQGSTDIPTLYDLLPGYLPMPHAGAHPTLDAYEQANRSVKGYWANTRAYLVSLLKAWWGDVATADNDYCYGHLPQLTGDHSTYRTTLDMLDGKIAGFFLWGQNPAVGSAHSRLHRLAMAELDWLVVRDLVEVESATFWKNSPEIGTGELQPSDIGTEVFFLPGASHTEKDGTFTNTQRLLQWHHKAVEPQGDCQSDLSFVYHVGRRIREKLAGSDDPKDAPLRDLTWDYPTHGPKEEVDAAAVLREINGWHADGRALSSLNEITDDGSTACGCWIYSGCYADGVNQTARRKPGREQDWVAKEWAWAWPDNRRILYNRASAAPDGTPWSARKAYVWWDAQQGLWTGHDTPDFVPDRPPDHEPAAGAQGPDALRGDDPFIMQADGKGWLFAPDGLVDGPFPTHYEPHESPVDNPLYGVQANPTRQRFPHPLNPDNVASGDGAADDDAYPFVITTYRIAEHHTAGGMSRFGKRLAELAPELYLEVDPALARRRGLTHGGWATVVTARSAIEGRVLVTERMRPLRIGGHTVHQIGVPYHFGPNGRAVGDAANDLLPIVLDPNVHISEFKAATCDIRPGRRPRGPALRAFVEAHGGGRGKGRGR